MEGVGVNVYGDELLISACVRFLGERQSDEDAVGSSIRKCKRGLMVMMRGVFCFGENSFKRLEQGRAK